MKNCFKTARNCWVASESMEVVYATHPLVHNIFVHGTPDERDLIAIVSPEREPFTKWAQKYLSNSAGGKAAKLQLSFEDVCSNKAVCKAFVAELQHHAFKNNLLPEEHIAAVHCDPTPFEHSSGGLFTSTLKLRRNIATKFYKMILGQLFAEVDNKETPSIPQ
ncbi:eukaryotic long-chain fatty acid CoA synthetase (LC-FACS) [Coemansia sp. IMI 209127]|nr:eukaryotic long-chain fatty acid CoA synthetase (LC-FACS) [Coemansia sp. IMI 209127]